MLTITYLYSSVLNTFEEKTYFLWIVILSVLLLVLLTILFIILNFNQDEEKQTQSCDTPTINTQIILQEKNDNSQFVVEEKEPMDEAVRKLNEMPNEN